MGLRWWHFALFAAIYVYSFPYFDRLRNANEMPRVLMTRAMVDHGTFRLDPVIGELPNRFDTSVSPRGNIYPNKPPGPSLLAVPVYLVCKLLGTTSLRAITWAFRVFAVTLPLVLFLPAFYRFCRRFSTDEWSRRMALVAFALGCQVMPYAMLFMSHALTAIFCGSAFIAAVYRVRGMTGRPNALALWSGFSCSVAVCMDYQSALPSIVIGFYVLLCDRRRWSGVALMAAGALPIAAFLAMYHSIAYGGVLKTGYSYAVDASLKNGFMGLVGPSWVSFVNTLWLPSNGLFVLAPWVVLALVGGVAVAVKREWRRRCGAEALACAVIFVGDALMLSSLIPYMSRSGWSLGPRYMTVVMPFVAWLSIPGFQVLSRALATRVLAMVLVLTSVAIFLVGATTYPHWPDSIANPLFEISFALLRKGYAVHSLGTLVGLEGLPSIVPLYVLVAGAIVWLVVRGTRRSIAMLALSAVLATAAVTAHGRFPRSGAHADRVMHWITAVWEPKRG